MAEEKKKKETKKNNSMGTKTTASKTKKAPKKTTSSTKTTTKKATPKTTKSTAKTAKSTTTKKVATKNTKTATKSSTAKKTTPSKKVEIKNKEEVKEEKTIQINQKNLITGIVIALLVVSLILICVFGSTSTKYQKSSEESIESTTEGNSVLEQAQKESEEIKEDERTAPKTISVDDYLDLYKSDETSLVLISKESCGYCQIAVPIIENIIYTDGVEINHVDVGNMSDDDTAKLIGSDDYFSEGYGTPLILAVGENSIKDKIEGLTTKEGYKEFFKKYSSEE